MKKLELIAFNIACCLEIEKAGAHRIELCANPYDGGTTPSAGFITSARKKISIELFPIIRPRGGNFLYTEDEFEVIKADVLFCKKAGCDGVVTGMLQPNGFVDKIKLAEVVALAHPMQVTFHRAFDRTNDPWQALEDIIDAGCSRILTSGQQPTALQGRDMIRKLIEKAANRIVIMPGSGIRSSNIRELADLTLATEFHSSARKVGGSPMQYVNSSLVEEQGHAVLDTPEVLKMLQILQPYNDNV